MAEIAEALATAVEHHRAGRLGEAEGIYRRILAVEPWCAQAWHSMGTGFEVGLCPLGSLASETKLRRRIAGSYRHLRSSTGQASATL